MKSSYYGVVQSYVDILNSLGLTREFDTTVYKCLHGLAPKYLADLCVPVAEVAGRRQLRSASRGLLDFPRFNIVKLRPTCVFVRRLSHLEFTT